MRALRAAGFWAYKIPDPLPHEALKTRDRPFDIVFLGPVCGAIECKIAPARFKKHQLVELQHVEESGAISGSLIYIGRAKAAWFPASKLRSFIGKRQVHTGFLISKLGGIWDVSRLCALWSASSKAIRGGG